MKILELFCGTKSISNVFKERGHEVYTVDIEEKFNPDMCINILDFETFMLPSEWRTPEVIWASPPCTTFSVAAIYRYWEDSKPKTWKTYIGLAIAFKTMQIIKELWNEKNNLKFFVENPTAMLRKQFFMQEFHRKTLTYCQYGHKARKSTDIWTNQVSWIPKPCCKNGADCHVGAARGQHSGVQDVKCLHGLNKAQTRAIIPRDLCLEILNVCEGKHRIVQKQLRADA